MKKAISVVFFLLSVLVLSAQEYDERLFAKYTQQQLKEMKTDRLDEFNYVNACLDFGCYLANFKGKDSPKEVIGEIEVKDLSKINFFELGVQPVKNRYLYYKIKGQEKLLVIRSIEHIKLEAKKLK
jgi:hypothetical protein